MRGNRFRSILWVLALTIIVLLSYWKIVFTKQFSIVWQWEMVSQYYAWDTYAAANVHKGIVPLWDPFRYGGTSFTGEMQTGLFYPFKLALYLTPLDENGLLSERAYNLFYVFGHWLAAFSMFLLVRYLKLGNFAALIAGVCFGLGGFVQWTAWLNILNAMPWLPLIVLFVLRAHASERSSEQLINASVAGLALGMTWLAGSVHIAIMDSIAAASLIAYLWLSNRAHRPFRWAGMALAAVLCTSILFGALQLFPSLEYAPRAYRWVGGDTAIRPFERILYPVLASTTFGPQSLFALVFGEADAGISDWTPYFGVLPLVLAIIGIWKYWKRPMVRYLAGLAALAFVYSWGASSFLHGVLYLAPYLDMAREADRYIYLTQFAMAVLAGFGVQFLFEDRRPGEALSVPALISILKWTTIGFAMLLAAASLRLPVPATEKTYLSFFFIAAAYGLLVFLQHAQRTTGPQLILVFLIAWDLYSFNWMIRPRTEMRKKNENALENLIHDRDLAEFIKSQPGMPRVHIDPMEQPPNLGDAYGVPITWAMSASLLMDYTRGYGSDRQNDLFGVRYTIRHKNGKSAAAPVYSNDAWDVYENPGALPRAWVVHKADYDPSTDRAFQRVMDPSFDLRRAAVIERPPENLNGGSLDSADNVRWLTYEPNRLELEVAVDAPGLLVLGEMYYPGWIARVDGSPVAIYRADGLIRAIPVQKGTHRVSLRYQPASVRWGSILTLLTFSGVSAAYVLHAAGRRSKKKTMSAVARGSTL